MMVHCVVMSPAVEPPSNIDAPLWLLSTAGGSKTSLEFLISAIDFLAFFFAQFFSPWLPDPPFPFLFSFSLLIEFPPLGAFRAKKKIRRCVPSGGQEFRPEFQSFAGVGGGFIYWAQWWSIWTQSGSGGRQSDRSFIFFNFLFQDGFQFSLDFSEDRNSTLTSHSIFSARSNQYNGN